MLLRTAAPMQSKGVAQPQTRSGISCICKHIVRVHRCCNASALSARFRVMPARLFDLIGKQHHQHHRRCRRRRHRSGVHHIWHVIRLLVSAIIRVCMQYPNPRDCAIDRRECARTHGIAISIINPAARHGRLFWARMDGARWTSGTDRGGNHVRKSIQIPQTPRHFWRRSCATAHITREFIQPDIRNVEYGEALLLVCDCCHRR